MSSLRDKLAAKARRRAVVPVEVGQLTDADERRVVALQAQLLLALRDGDEDQAQSLQGDIDALKDSVVVAVHFTALDPTDFEKVTAAYPSEDGADNGLDWHAALPVLAALCADDEDLQDDEWWADQLAAGTWNQGEQLALWQALLHINTTAPSPYIPKG